MSAAITEKARRLIAEGSLEPIRIGADFWVGHVRSGSTRYVVAIVRSPHGADLEVCSCTCPARSACSHLTAVLASMTEAS